jgi:hypothetical protein
MLVADDIENAAPSIVAWPSNGLFTKNVFVGTCLPTRCLAMGAHLTISIDNILQHPLWWACNEIFWHIIPLSNISHTSHIRCLSPPSELHPEARLAGLLQESSTHFPLANDQCAVTSVRLGGHNKHVTEGAALNSNEVWYKINKDIRVEGQMCLRPLYSVRINVHNCTRTCKFM